MGRLDFSGKVIQAGYDYEIVFFPKASLMLGKRSMTEGVRWVGVIGKSSGG